MDSVAYTVRTSAQMRMTFYKSTVDRLVSIWESLGASNFIWAYYPLIFYCLEKISSISYTNVRQLN